MHDLEEKLKKVAEFFCEDKKKFKIEELFVRLLKFAEQLPVLAKVSTQNYIQSSFMISFRRTNNERQWKRKKLNENG